jgi:hypothetical protein
MEPKGKGLYLREGGIERTIEYAKRAKVTWVAYDPTTSAARPAHDVAALRAAGFPVWLYATPEDWKPSAWRRTLQRLERLARETGAQGLIADPERVSWWEAAGGAEALHELGVALGQVRSRGLDVGITSIALWPEAWLRALASSGAWGSPQLYHDPADPEHRLHGPGPASGLSRWRSAGFTRIYPSVAWYWRDGYEQRRYQAQFLERYQATVAWMASPKRFTDPAFIAFRDWEPTFGARAAAFGGGVLLGLAALGAGLWYWFKNR